MTDQEPARAGVRRSRPASADAEPTAAVLVPSGPGERVEVADAEAATQWDQRGWRHLGDQPWS